MSMLPMPMPSLLPPLTREIDEHAFDAAGVAFFDLDRTLLDGYSILPFLSEAIASGMIRPGRLLEQAKAVFEEGRDGLGPLLERFIASLAGEREAILEALGERVFEKHLASRIHPEARALVRAHRARGHRVVIVTSATRYQAEPVARALGIARGDLLCTRLVVDDSGRLTGKWYLPGCWNAGKRLRARAWLRRHGGRLDNAWFYTDSFEDLPLLERVGHPRAVNPDAALERRARLAGWPVLRFRTRRPTIESVVRTSLCVGSLYGSMLVGASRLLRGGSVRDAVDVATDTWSRTGLAFSGVRLRINGEAYLRGRPAVVVFNHQSALDALIMTRLLRQDFTGICKQELQRDPLVGAAFRAAGMVFVDRSAKDGAAQLAPALAALRAGRTLAIAPEGQRSYGTRPLAFKRGAFYLARRARVPLIPVVIHNAADVLPRGSALVRGDVPIEVTVLPPRDAASWRARDLGAHAEALHAQYLELLGFAPSRVMSGQGPATEDDLAIAV